MLSYDPQSQGGRRPRQRHPRRRSPHHRFQGHPLRRASGGREPLARPPARHPLGGGAELPYLQAHFHAARSRSGSQQHLHPGMERGPGDPHERGLPVSERLDPCEDP